MFATGCPRPTDVVETKIPAVDATPEKVQTELEKDIDYVRNGGFQYVFVVRRKDGGAWTGEDTKTLRTNIPLATNQKLLSDGGKAVVIGTNFRFFGGLWDKFSKAFNVQDLSEVKYEKNEFDDKPLEEKTKESVKKP